MVVQIVAEHVDQVDRVVPAFLAGVPREEHKSDVANVVPRPGVRLLELHRGLTVAEQHLWGRVAGFPTFFEFLHEHLTKPRIR